MAFFLDLVYDAKLKAASVPVVMLQRRFVPLPLTTASYFMYIYFTINKMTFYLGQAGAVASTLSSQQDGPWFEPD